MKVCVIWPNKWVNVIFVHNFARKRIVFCKIYTAGKKFTQHPVVTVVTNFKSGRAPSTPRLSFYSFIMIVVDLQRWLWCKNIDETFVTLQNLFHTPWDIFLRIQNLYRNEKAKSGFVTDADCYVMFLTERSD